MGGGYISCGDFLGEDKSGSAISGVFEALEPLLSAEASDVMERLNADVEQRFDEGEQEFRIPPPLAALLVEPLERYQQELGARLGHPDPAEAPDLDRASGLDPIDAKWGAGDGWRYYCVHDLLQACQLSRESGQPVVVSFD